jgi:RimJ/RimL family protein N-acetyltransferase
VPLLRLRPVRAEDLPTLAQGGVGGVEDDPFQFFGHRPSNGLARRFAADGLLTDDTGMLAVENEEATMLGSVGWHAVWHGPGDMARALNIGITLLPEQRGRGYGTAAQEALAHYLFQTTLVERLEAGTDVDNLAEQRALEKAAFQREGVLRHAQYRRGQWHDLVLYGRLRDDPVQ